MSVGEWNCIMGRNKKKKVGWGPESGLGVLGPCLRRTVAGMSGLWCMVGAVGSKVGG